MKSKRGKSKTKQQKMQEQQQSDEYSDYEDGNKDYISLRHKKKTKKTGQQEVDPSFLLKDYNEQNYQKYIKSLKEMLANQKPKDYSQEPQIKNLIYMGDNLCFYGYGSKRQFLKSLRLKYFPNHYCWEVKGYLPTINIKKIYNNFGNFLKAAGVTKQIIATSMKEQIQQYRIYLTKYYTNKNPLIIFFHCLDGQNLMSVQHQKSLSQLFALPGIRVICTFDNVRIVMLWSPKTKQTFRFLFHKIDTNIPSIEEQVFRPNPNEKTDRTQKRIMNIVQSLNKNQKLILRLIALNQCNNLNKDIPYYYTVSQLLQVCIEQVILSSDTQLRQNLIELIDHEVIHEKILQTRAKKVLKMNLDKRLLQKLADLKID